MLELELLPAAEPELDELELDKESEPDEPDELDESEDMTSPSTRCSWPTRWTRRRPCSWRSRGCRWDRSRSLEHHAHRAEQLAQSAEHAGHVVSASSLNPCTCRRTGCRTRYRVGISRHENLREVKFLTLYRRKC